MSAKDREQLYNHAAGVGDEPLPRRSAVSVIRHVRSAPNGRTEETVFKLSFSKLPRQAWGPYSLGETIRELTVSALLDPVTARNLVFEAATEGSATTETR
jgi:hypothetical protein